MKSPTKARTHLRAKPRVQYESEMTIQGKCKNTEFSFNKYTMNLITT